MDKPNYVGVVLTVKCSGCNGTGDREPWPGEIGGPDQFKCENCYGAGRTPRMVSFEEFVDILDEKRREVIEKKVTEK